MTNSTHFLSDEFYEEANDFFNKTYDKFLVSYEFDFPSLNGFQSFEMKEQKKKENKKIIFKNGNSRKKSKKII